MQTFVSRLACVSGKFLLVLVSVYVLAACAPKVGSPEWCKAFEEKPKGEITLNEAGDYAKHCIFK